MSTIPTIPTKQADIAPPDLWSESGVFAQHFHDYEPRSQQKEMYDAVLETLSEGGHLLIEAGTGTGKGMAYLVPIILLSVKDPDMKFVVTTNTINLQQQLVEKDIPETLEALEKAGLIKPGQFQYTTLKGKNNYLCRHGYEAFRDQNTGKGWEPADELIKTIENWETDNGDRIEINVKPAQMFPWGLMSANYSSGCPFFQAKEYDPDNPCYLRRARFLAQESNLIVANHALFLADMDNSEPQLGHTTHVIIDESHHLEEEASNQFGWQMAEEDANDTIKILKDDPVLGVKASDMGRAWRNYWKTLGDCTKEPQYRDELITVLIDSKLRNTYSWHLAIEAFDDLIEKTDSLLAANTAEINRANRTNDPHREASLRPIREIMSSHKKHIIDLMSGHDPMNVQWLEKTMANLLVKDIPLNVAPTLRKMLFDNKTATVLTSATLATNKDDFTLIRSRIGFPEDGREIALDSPFNYPKQALFMSPIDIPTPKESEFSDAVAECIIDLAIELDGHTLALFTSYAALYGTAKRIKPALEGHNITVMAQGRDGTPNQIVDQFRNDPKAIILGTASFWEGVDLSHDLLKAVVICRLPFPVPTDPVIKARSETFNDAFNEYHTPMAIIRFRQGCGRLIRNRHSKGSIVVLDSRIRNKNYGMKFFRSLPKSTTAKAFMHNVGKIAKKWTDS